MAYFVERDNKKFKLEEATQCIVDAYDENIGSVELSHEEVLDFFELTEIQYMVPPYDGSLDLTWMKKDDGIQLEKTSENSIIKSIAVNIDNLVDAYLPTDAQNFNDLNLIVNNNNSKMNPIMMIKIFKNFMNFHYKNGLSNGVIAISGVNFQGFSPIMVSILSKICQKNQVQTIEKSNDDKRIR